MLLTKDCESIVKVIAEASEQYRLLPGLVYRCFYDFIAKHGREYPVAGPFIGKQRGVQLMCYGNSIAHAVLYNLKYVEGFALSPKDGRLFMHAWNDDGHGNVYDSTWLNTGLVYIGVEFSVERADDATWNGDACVLNDENRNYPIFQKPWTGEDYTIQWPFSDRLEALRRIDFSLVSSVLKHQSSPRPTSGQARRPAGNRG